MNQRNKFAQVIRGIILEGTGVAVLIFLFLTMHAEANEAIEPGNDSTVPAVTQFNAGAPLLPFMDRVSEIFSIGDTPEPDRPVPIRHQSWATFQDSSG